MNPVGGPIYRIMEWITRFAYLQLLWILFTLLGGIILGFFPSTIAMHAIIRKWLNGNHDIALFPTFWNFYKNEFWKSNVLGIFLIIFSGLIVLDFYYIEATTDQFFQFKTIPLYMFMLLFLFFLFYVFPVFVHYDLKVRYILKNAFLIMLISPIHTLLMIVTFVSMYFIINMIPALLFIFGGVLYAFITTWISLDRFKRIEDKKN
ncbi:YesL family protein [Salirhabdus sp. Marseille-P4669]|uniref:YesL family protein n=1 Tax=Salirhabdus sp. Marseille-P4669 TaxID=2042310 RepID=UPI000C7D1DB9|nr:YesL family protein [Salirhabdus sp. Marseille-P4669]